MPQFDQERIVKLVSELRASVGRLKELGLLSQRTFLEDPDKIGSAKYHFIVAIEAGIDMCNHVIARNGYRVPEDYGDTFRVMAEVGALDTGSADDLAKMAKFRNRLVHLYWEVDDRQVYEIIHTCLGDFKNCLTRFPSSLDGKNGETTYERRQKVQKLRTSVSPSHLTHKT
jgi:uncharacterized protein YutE (UPF0331/DUF86 family)